MARKPSNEVIIEALQRSGGVMSAAAKMLNTSRVSLYKWLEKNAKLREAREQAEESLLDLAESKLFKAIEKGDMTAIIFTLKTRGKTRGYVERQEINIDKNATIEVGYTQDED